MAAGNENINQISIGKAAWRVITRHFDAVSTVTIVQIAVRAAVFVPLLLSSSFGGKLPPWMTWLMALAVYIALVIPLRFWAKEKMRRQFYTRHMPRKKRNPYERWLKTGLLRYLRGILWGLPFIVSFGYVFICYYVLDGKTYWQPFHWLGNLLAGKSAAALDGGNVGLALVIVFALIIVFALLFAYGWWRDLPMEYLPVRSLGTVKSLHWSKRILKKYRGQMRKCTFVNALLCLPALIGAGIVLVPYVKERINFSLGAETVFATALRTLRSSLPTTQLLALAVVALALYLPLCVFRKTRNAALMGRLMKDNVHHIHHSEQQANNEPPIAPKIVHLEGTPLSHDPKPAEESDHEA